MSQNATLEAPAEPQNCPGMNPPTPQHDWLQRFLGTWVSSGEVNCGADEPMNLSGTETSRSLGGFWIHTQIESDNPQMPYSQVCLVGYDSEKSKYIGTVVDSMSGHRWLSEGVIEGDGSILAMYTEGPFPFRPDPMSKFRDATEFKSEDHKIFTSSVQEADGSWTTIMKMEARRQK